MLRSLFTSITKLASVDLVTITEPKRYTWYALNDIKNKQGMYLTVDDTKYYYQDNKQHRTDGPAMECANGDKAYCRDGKLHRIDGPAIEHADGTKKYYLNGKLHRIDGPAVEYVNGDKEYYRKGKRHRIDGPAMEYAAGSKAYFQNDKRHRTDGPAIERANGDKVWYIDNERLSEQEYLSKIGSNSINVATTTDQVTVENPVVTITKTNDLHTITVTYHNKE